VNRCLNVAGLEGFADFSGDLLGVHAAHIARLRNATQAKKKTPEDFSRGFRLRNLAYRRNRLDL
jgi:hypothetical protein